jgi:hypothetical protein
MWIFSTKVTPQANAACLGILGVTVTNCGFVQMDMSVNGVQYGTVSSDSLGFTFMCKFMLEVRGTWYCVVK